MVLLVAILEIILKGSIFQLTYQLSNSNQRKESAR
jgi:hypothetical protein